jgi:hypothetical protein
MAPDRRKCGRSDAWVEAECHLRGVVRRARLTGASQGGCRAQVAFEGMVPGDRVVLQLSELLALPATVVWVDEGGETGLEFTSPMVGAMLGQYILQYGRREGPH